MQPNILINAVSQWAAQDDRIIAVALVGSHARNEARADSDIDLVLICENPDALLQDVSWAQEFGEARVGDIEDYGLVRSVRAFYAHGPEVEFGLTSKEWVTSPIDEETAKVMLAGLRTLYDAGRLFETALKDARERFD